MSCSENDNFISVLFNGSCLLVFTRLNNSWTLLDSCWCQNLTYCIVGCVFLKENDNDFILIGFQSGMVFVYRLSAQSCEKVTQKQICEELTSVRSFGEGLFLCSQQNRLLKLFRLNGLELISTNMSPISDFSDYFYPFLAFFKEKHAGIVKVIKENVQVATFNCGLRVENARFGGSNEHASIGLYLIVLAEGQIYVFEVLTNDCFWRSEGNVRLPLDEKSLHRCLIACQSLCGLENDLHRVDERILEMFTSSLGIRLNESELSEIKNRVHKDEAKSVNLNSLIEYLERFSSKIPSLVSSESSLKNSPLIY
ncbi:hypothetical protein ACOME3_004819 [Neoechinorhynchus agilis]